MDGNPSDDLVVVKTDLGSLLTKAADVLEDHATALRDGQSVGGVFDSDADCDTYNAEMNLVAALRFEAKNGGGRQTCRCR